MELNELVGQDIANYHVERLIGRGGMGSVFLARHRLLGNPAAIKVLAPEFSSNAEMVARFEREARNAAALNHPDIVSVFDIGRLDGLLWMAMPFIEGRSLRHIIDAGPMDLVQACLLMDRVLEAIAWAHARSVLHRDLKPDNIIVTPEGYPRITDFGLARNMATDEQLTAAGQVIGTPLYMPVEQWDAHELDERTDVYALGITFYEMLCGKPPFPANMQPGHLFRLIADADFLTPREVDPMIPEPLERVCLQMMALDAEERYPDAEAAREALLAALAELDIAPAAELTRRLARTTPADGSRRPSGLRSGVGDGRADTPLNPSGTASQPPNRPIKTPAPEPDPDPDAPLPLTEQVKADDVASRILEDVFGAPDVPDPTAGTDPPTKELVIPSPLESADSTDLPDLDRIRQQAQEVRTPPPFDDDLDDLAGFAEGALDDSPDDGNDGDADDDADAMTFRESTGDTLLVIGGTDELKRATAAMEAIDPDAIEAAAADEPATTDAGPPTPTPPPASTAAFTPPPLKPLPDDDDASDDDSGDADTSASDSGDEVFELTDDMMVATPAPGSITPRPVSAPADAGPPDATPATGDPAPPTDPADMDDEPGEPRSPSNHSLPTGQTMMVVGNLESLLQMPEGDAAAATDPPAGGETAAAPSSAADDEETARVDDEDARLVGALTSLSLEPPPVDHTPARPEEPPAYDSDDENEAALVDALATSLAAYDSARQPKPARAGDEAGESDDDDADAAGPDDGDDPPGDGIEPDAPH